MTIQSSAEATDFFESYAKRRHLPSHVKVRSTTPRRSRTSKLLAVQFHNALTQICICG